VDPVGVAARRLAAQAQGRSEISPPLGSFFEAPQPGPPKETRPGAGWFFNSLFSPFPSLFYHPLGPRPLRAGLTNSHKTENHIKLKNAGRTPALTQEALLNLPRKGDQFCAVQGEGYAFQSIPLLFRKAEDYSAPLGHSKDKLFELVLTGLMKEFKDRFFLPLGLVLRPLWPLLLLLLLLFHDHLPPCPVPCGTGEAVDFCPLLPWMTSPTGMGQLIEEKRA